MKVYHSLTSSKFLMFVNPRRGAMFFAVFLCIFMITGKAQAQSSSCKAVNCTFSLNFDGAERYGTGWGAQANVGDYQVKGVCISSSAWSMIDNQSSGNELAQVGYLRLAQWSTSKTYYFYEYGDQTTLYNPVMLAVDTKNWGASDEFTTYYNSGNGYIEPVINGQVQVYIYVTWGANDQQWFAEVHSPQDYVVGGYNHHSLFGNVQYLFSGKWYNINTSSYMYNDTPYGTFYTTGSSFYVWDTRVS